MLLCHKINKCLSAVSAVNIFGQSFQRMCMCPIGQTSKTSNKQFISQIRSPVENRRKAFLFRELFTTMYHRDIFLSVVEMFKFNLLGIENFYLDDCKKKKAFLCTVVHCQTVLISLFLPCKQTLTAEMWPHKYVLYDRKKDEQVLQPLIIFR